MTLEQKEQITMLFSLIYTKFNRAKYLAESLGKMAMQATVVQNWSKEIREEIESGEKYVDKLKLYLMEIDKEEK